MSDASITPSTATAKFRWPLWLKGLVLLLPVAGLAVGSLFYFEKPAGPQPPVIEREGIEASILSAIDRANRKVLESPRSANAWGELGMVLRAHGYEYQGEACFSEAERLEPGNARWVYYRALHAAMREPDHAIALLRKAVSLPHRDEQSARAARLRLAEELSAREEWNEADDLLREELQERPNDERARYDSGAIALARNDLSTAEKHFRAARSSPYARKKAASHLASIAFRQGDRARASQLEREAAALPDDLPWPDAYFRDLALLAVGVQAEFRQVQELEQQGRIREAAQRLVEMSEAHPSARTFVEAGIFLGQLGEFARAESFLRRCLALEPDDVRAHYFLSLSLFSQAEQRWSILAERPHSTEMLREARTHANRAAELQPNHALALFIAGRSSQMLDRPEEAEKQFRTAIAYRADFLDAYLHLAETLRDLGKSDEAIELLKKAEAMASPNDPRPKQLLEGIQKKK